MNNTHNDNTQDNAEGGTDFRKKVARSLSQGDTVQVLQQQGETFVTLPLEENEAVLMQGREVEDWLADDDNRQAFFEAQEARKREDQLKADDIKADDARRAAFDRQDGGDADTLQQERDRSEEEERDALLDSFSLDEDHTDRPMSPQDSAINERAWNQYVQTSRQEQPENVAQSRVEPYDRASMGDSKFYDIRGNAVTMEQIDAIMKSRAEVNAHLNAHRTAASRAAGYDQAAISQKDAGRLQQAQYSYHQGVNAQAAASQTGTASASPEAGPQNRGDLLRAYAATVATRDKEATQERERELDRNNGR